MRAYSTFNEETEDKDVIVGGREDGIKKAREGRRPKLGAAFEIALFKELQRTTENFVHRKDEKDEGERMGGIAHKATKRELPAPLTRCPTRSPNSRILLRNYSSAAVASAARRSIHIACSGVT